jgi:hypothetical protein
MDPCRELEREMCQDLGRRLVEVAGLLEFKTGEMSFEPTRESIKE